MRRGRGWKLAWIKVLSGLALNLSAGWFAVVLIVPNFSPIKGWEEGVVLFYDLVFGSIFLLIAVGLEKTGQ